MQQKIEWQHLSCKNWVTKNSSGGVWGSIAILWFWIRQLSTKYCKVFVIVVVVVVVVVFIHWNDSAFLLLNAAAKPCPLDVTLHAVAF